MTGYWHYPGLQKTKPDAPWFKRRQVHGRNWGIHDDTLNDDSTDGTGYRTDERLKSMMPV